MSNILFRGIYPALPTPLNKDSKVKESAVQPLMHWLLSKGVQGFYVLGGTGEGAVLEEKERMRMAEAAVAARENAAIILQIGAIDSFSAIRLAKHASSLGVDAISSVLPNFYYQYSSDEVCAYFDALVQASGLPMLCYCNALTGTGDVVATVEKLMRVQGVIGVKYTMPDYFNLQRIKKLNGGDINVLNGPDQTLLCGLTMGADGGIGTSYNLAPEWFTAIYRAFQAGDLDTARRYQYKVDGMVEVLRAFGPIRATKLCLEAMGFAVGNVAFPGKAFDEDEKEAALSRFRQAGVLPEA